MANINDFFSREQLQKAAKELNEAEAMKFEIDIDKDDQEIFNQIKGNVINPNCFGSPLISSDTWKIVNFPDLEDS